MAVLIATPVIYQIDRDNHCLQKNISTTQKIPATLKPANIEGDSLDNLSNKKRKTLPIDPNTNEQSISLVRFFLPTIKDPEHKNFLTCLYALEIKDQDKKTALHLAVKAGNLEVVQILSKADKIDLTIKDIYGDTALHLTVKYGFFELTKELINANAHLNLKNKRGYTALHLAVKYGFFELTKELIDASADLNLKNKRGYTALHLASKYGFLELIKELINANANLNLKNERGYTALHLTYLLSKKDTFNVLVACQGVDLTVLNNQGESVYHYMAIQDNELLEYLPKEMQTKEFISKLLLIKNNQNQTVLNEIINYKNFTLLKEIKKIIDPIFDFTRGLSLSDNLVQDGEDFLNPAFYLSDETEKEIFNAFENNINLLLEGVEKKIMLNCLSYLNYLKTCQVFLEKCQSIKDRSFDSSDNWQQELYNCLAGILSMKQTKLFYSFSTSQQANICFLAHYLNKKYFQKILTEKPTILSKEQLENICITNADETVKSSQELKDLYNENKDQIISFVINRLQNKYGFEFKKQEKAKIKTNSPILVIENVTINSSLASFNFETNEITRNIITQELKSKKEELSSIAHELTHYLQSYLVQKESKKDLANYDCIGLVTQADITVKLLGQYYDFADKFYPQPTMQNYLYKNSILELPAYAIEREFEECITPALQSKKFENSKL